MRQISDALSSIHTALTSDVTCSGDGSCSTVASEIAKHIINVSLSPIVFMKIIFSAFRHFFYPKLNYRLIFGEEVSPNFFSQIKKTRYELMTENTLNFL